MIIVYLYDMLLLWISCELPDSCRAFRAICSGCQIHRPYKGFHLVKGKLTDRLIPTLPVMIANGFCHR